MFFYHSYEVGIINTKPLNFIAVIFLKGVFLFASFFKLSYILSSCFSSILMLVYFYIIPEYTFLGCMPS